MSSLASLSKTTINEFDYVLLKKETNMKVVQVITNRAVSMCRSKFVLNGVIGHGYGSSFKLQNGQLIIVDLKEPENSGEKDEEADSNKMRDNRSLIDRGENQRLSKEEINHLHKQGITGEGIVEHLIENSSTFQKKTEYSQQKYVQKKTKKHVMIFTALRPCTRTLVEMYYSRGPTKICNLRIDSLAQILTQSNIRACSKVMVVESCSGLVLGALLERIGGQGAVVHLFTGSAPTRPALNEGYHFSESTLQCLHSFPLNCVSTLARPTDNKMSPDVVEASEIKQSSIDIVEVSDGFDAAMTDQENRCSHVLSASHEPDLRCESEKKQEISVTENPTAMDISTTQVTEINEENVKLQEASSISLTNKPPSTTNDGKGNWRKRKFVDVEEREKRKLERTTQTQTAKSLIEKANMDGLIVAAKVHPTPIVMSLIDFVGPSRPIVVFSPYKEPLIDCFVKLRERGGVVMIKLTETWFREYQVLTDRTHPSINMSGSGGYLLTATTVALN